MARKLPWNAQPNAKPPSTIKLEDGESKKSPRRSTSTDDDLNRVSTHHQMEKKSFSQQASNSPPPPAPPPEEFMIDGVENDDGWMMVEDELLTTARLFTAHLHHAEYQRLKELARTHPADRLARAADRASAASATLKRLAEGASTDAIDEMDNEELDPYNNDPLLSGLMNAPEQLETLAGTQSKDANQQAGMETADRQPERSASGTRDGSHISSIFESRKRTVTSGQDVGISSDQQPRRVGFDIESPMKPRANILPAKLAAKLAKRKLSERKEGGEKKAHDVEPSDAGIGDVPTFLL